jgi:integrase
MPKLTDKGVAALTGGNTRKEIPDTYTRGLYLIVQPSGAKSWAVRYRVDGRPVKDTIGAYPAWSLAEARGEADRRLKIAGKGADPRAARKDERRADQERRDRTFAAIATDFIERYAKPRNRHWRETHSTLERHCVPHWGDRPIDEIRRRDIADRLDEIVLSGEPYAARHVLAAVRRLFNWAVERELIDASPCDGIKAPIRVAKRERVLSDDEVKVVWNAAEASGYPFGAFVRLLLLTGCRRNEIATLRWSDIDDGQAVVTIPGERYKTGRPHVVPLSGLAQEIIAAVPKVEGCPYLFSTRRARKAVEGDEKKERPYVPLSGFSKMKRDFDRLTGGIDFDLHDLRRTVRTGLSRLRIADHVAERVLGHVQGGVAAHYDHWAYADEKREALEAWARHVESLIRPAPANVVPLREVATTDSM